jgi:nitroreductase / dihydropteridine reductase
MNPHYRFMSFLANIEWRRAIKHFGSPDEPLVIDPVIRAMTQAPSSFGLQPYKFIVVTNRELLSRLRPVCYDQPQIESCAALIIVCARTDIMARIDQYCDAAGLVESKPMMQGFVASLPDPTAWAARQAYIALGFGLAAAAELKIHSCPMEGFLPDQVAQVLLLENTLVPVALLALGNPPAIDAADARFRFSCKDLVRTQ